MNELASPRKVTRVDASGATATRVDALVVEAPMEFRLHGVPIAVLMRTPGHDEDLARGFLLSEGIVLSPAEFAGIRRVGGSEEDDRWDIALAEGVIVDPEQFRRNLYTTSSCGVCGKASIDAVRIVARPAGPGPRLDAATILRMPATMRIAQDTFESTGGIHAAAAFDRDGEMIAACEDIGRHNAVDKVIGRIVLTRWPLDDVTLLVSGRVSFEIVQKAAVVGIPVVCGISAASSLAVELGEELGMTVIGFLRDDGFNGYTGMERFS